MAAWVDALPCDAAFFFDQHLQGEPRRQISADTARTPDVIDFWQGNAGTDSSEVDSKIGGGSSNDGGAQTPRGHMVAMKISMDELHTKLSSLGHPQQVQGAASVEKISGSRAPVPVGLVLSEPRLAPVHVPHPVAPQPPTPPPPMPPSQWGAGQRRAKAALAHPPPRPLVGMERPPRGDGGAGAAGTAAGAAHNVSVVSIGTVGHPTRCAEPCEEEFCEQGFACKKCHLCRVQGTLEMAQPVFTSEPACPSVGSVGHPHTCAEACKFHSKGKVCKDGALCTRCHACRWSRHAKKKQ